MDRLQAGERLSAQIEGIGWAAGEPMPVELVPGREIFFEEGKLEVEPTFRPTAAEIAAGLA